MFQNYFLLAWRHLLKNRSYSAINIAGLSIGMAIAIIIGLWITDEATFDHYAPDHSRISAVWLNMSLKNATKKEEFYTGHVIMMPNSPNSRLLNFDAVARSRLGRLIFGVAVTCEATR